jgi:enterochelin esterase family protein
MKTAALLLLATLVSASLLAQNSGTAGAETRRTNAAPRRAAFALVSPEVHGDRTVTFRIRTTNANEVKVSGNWPDGTSALTNDGKGNWSITLGPLAPEIYDYSLLVDGLTTVDTANPWVKPMRAARTSLLEVPGDPPRLWEFQDVRHGTVHEHTYFSKSLALKRRLRLHRPVTRNIRAICPCSTCFTAPATTTPPGRHQVALISSRTIYWPRARPSP